VLRGAVYRNESHEGFSRLGDHYIFTLAYRGDELRQTIARFVDADRVYV